MKGVVAAGHRLTAEAGARALRAGGNAFDAAVSAVLASFATESPLTGLGAGGFMLAHVEGKGDHLLDFFVEAGGRGQHVDRRAELVALEVVFDDVPQVFNIGPASCGVPGTAAGLWEAAQRWCSMPFDELIRPAVDFAREGVRVTTEHAYVFQILEPILTHYPETRALYAPAGRMLGAGDLFRFPELADALERLAAEGPDWLYRGEVGESICDWVTQQGGSLSKEDLAAYAVVERQPVAAAFRGRQVLTNPPPSSGGILIAFALDLLERLGGPVPFDHPDALQLTAEVMAEAARARSELHDRLHEYGFADVFLSQPRLERAATGVASRIASAGPPAADPGERLGSTTHISTLDEDGNAVSVTCSNGTGSGVMTPGTGIHLNNMLGEEDLNPLGFHRLDPGTRVTSMMAPTIVLRDGEVEMAVGSAGSNRLRSAILQVIRYVVDCRMDIADAVRAGRIHYEAETLHAEPGFRAESLDELERRGYRVVRWKGLNLYFGGAQAVRRATHGTPLAGAGDPRRGGAAVVVE
jgi:gamma-glutamyltranspeptidase/glutathione hydrolase